MYHVANGAVYSKDLHVGEKLPMLEGEFVEVTRIFASTVIFNNNSKVLHANVVCTNGVVHIIDHVLLPANPPTTPAPPTNNLYDVSATYGEG